MDKETLRSGPFVFLPNDIKNIFNNILKYKIDPTGMFYGITKDMIIKDIDTLTHNTVHAVELENMDEGPMGNRLLEIFALGAGGRLTVWDQTSNNMTPVVFRGITKTKHMRSCEERGRDYYYMDTGYFGNGEKKIYHRITKNSMQHIGPIINRPRDRLSKIEWREQRFTPGRNILLCPPSDKAMSCFGLDLNEWLDETIDTIKQYTDRPIIVRTKPSRRDRVTTDTIQQALSNDVHCLVTYNSIAATEAILYGKPAFTLGPNAAHTMSLSDLSMIENPYYPSLDQVVDFAAHLSYCQFTEFEMRDGTAWKILNETSDLSFSDTQE